MKKFLIYTKRVQVADDHWMTVCCILTRDSFNIAQTVRGRPNNHSCKNTKEPTSCKNIIRWNKLDRWCLKKHPFILRKPNLWVIAKVPELCLLMQGLKRRRATNTLPAFCFQGLLKSCLIHDLHIQELRESILFCWGVHQGTFSSLVS